MTDHQAEAAASVLIEAMRVFDRKTADHLIATADLSVRIAGSMGLDDESKDDCRMGGLLHDIGMLAVDPSVLCQAGMLVNIEWAEMQLHPETSHRLLLGIPALNRFAKIVRAHHERFDGTGYPDGLIACEIPLESRIIAVADAFHTMTMPLAYRRAFSTQSAVMELIGNAGSQFDEEVVTEFKRMVGYRDRNLRLA